MVPRKPLPPQYSQGGSVLGLGTVPKAPARAMVSPGTPSCPLGFPLGVSPHHGGPSRAHTQVHGHTHGAHTPHPRGHMVGDGFPESAPRSHPKMPLSHKMAESRSQSGWEGRGCLLAQRRAPSGTGHPPAAPGGAGHTRALVHTHAGLRSLDLPREPGVPRTGPGGTNNPFRGAGCGLRAQGSAPLLRGVQRPRRGPGAQSVPRASGIHLLLQLGPAERSG